ncbi:MAG: D-aminoacyl-tRNA deacylase [Eggerthellaceae bacterium]|nr:D-aminoacyl-tRNA deacylase [Eggerthellaceae bacterium]
MRAVIQRVSSACVTIDGDVTGSIEAGYLILLGVSKNDNEKEAQKLWGKISKLRIFCDEDGKTNLSLHDIDGSVLVVSQFTLYANCKKGNRPSFTDAGSPDEADRLYEAFLALARADLGEERVAHGSFGAEMQVALVNDGPFTIVLDTDTL